MSEVPAAQGEGPPEPPGPGAGDPHSPAAFPPPAGPPAGAPPPYAPYPAAGAPAGDAPPYAPYPAAGPDAGSGEPGALPAWVGSPYASWGARLGGYLIDLVILGVIGALLNAILDPVHVLRWSFSTTNQTTHVVTSTHFSGLALGIQILVFLLYGAILVGGRRGQTVGMMAVGARAVDGATGGPIGFWRGLGRAAFEQLLVYLLFVPWVLDMLWPLWDARNQTFHDKVSRTVVMKRGAVPT